MYWNWRVKDMGESGMSGIQVTGECVVFLGIIWSGYIQMYVKV